MYNPLKLLKPNWPVFELWEMLMLQMYPHHREQVLWHTGHTIIKKINSFHQRSQSVDIVGFCSLNQSAARIMFFLENLRNVGKRILVAKNAFCRLGETKSPDPTQNDTTATLVHSQQKNSWPGISIKAKVIDNSALVCPVLIMYIVALLLHVYLSVGSSSLITSHRMRRHFCAS